MSEYHYTFDELQKHSYMPERLIDVLTFHFIGVKEAIEKANKEKRVIGFYSTLDHKQMRQEAGNENKDKGLFCILNSVLSGDISDMKYFSFMLELSSREIKLYVV